MSRRTRIQGMALLIALMLAVVTPCFNYASAEQISKDTSHFELGAVRDKFSISLTLPTSVTQRQAIVDFIEGWYNPHRRHSALG